jgi:uncharacterized YccA/Bax inhibitor family protein
MAVFGRTSSNPVLSDKSFERFDLAGSASMTVQGTVNKTIVGVMLTIASAAWMWTKMADGVNLTWALGAGIGGFIAAMVTYFKPTWGSITVPIYAVLKGMMLGAISAIFEAMYPGIVFQAVTLTFGTLFTMLFAYKTGLIKVTDKLRSGIVMATGAIFFAYLFSWIFSFFGGGVGFMHSNGLLGIGISLFVIVVAALNFLLDFDFIDRASASGAPKYMEWLGALGLLVTLIWLYVEFLRLFSRLNSD